MSRTRVLHDYVQAACAQLTKVAKQPLGSVRQPDEAFFETNTRGL